MPQFRILSILVLMVLGGCHTTPDQQETATQRISKPIPAEQSAEISLLLARAEQAMQKQRLTTPPDDSAYLRYLQVLSRDPDNQDALLGLSRIVETYLSWAVAALNRDEFSRASAMLTKANSVDENHPDLAPLWARLETARQRERDLIALPAEQVTERSTALAQRLREMAENSQSRETIIKIRARTDADGRWIYQQMNLGTETRLRATIHTGLPPAVQLSYP